jgi:formylglycine-generating enzyme required for sulfatase activity
MSDHALDRFEGQALDDQVVIDRLCTEYEGALRAGENPSLEEYLQKANVSDTACLLTELVVIDRAYRGEGVSRDGYVARFPTFAAAIDEAFGAAVRSTASAPSRSRVITPPTIEGYEILGELGRGGMGVVFKARHLRLKRLVALKLILHGDFASEKHRARFLIETEMLGRLRHSNVVQVFEAGQQDGRPFLALEFIEGGTLAQRLASAGPLGPREAAALVRDLARGIHHAHLQGVIHRDLKPANVLLSSDGTPKVTDFGVACQPGGNEMSQTGQLIGTPGYMPPEQARGERESLGPRADVYSLGAVLYEVLTGQAPFRGATPLETVRRVLNDEPTPPARLRPGLDPDLSTICLKCLSKEPEGRYASADALADDLTRWLGGEPIAARPAGAAERAWKWARRKPTQAGLLAVSLLLVLTVIVLPTVAALRLSREQELTRQADEQRRRALVQSLHTAVPESVPFLVKELAAAPDQVLPLLREQLDDPATRFRAAVALTLLGDDQIEYLLTTIPMTHPSEVPNLVRAFRARSNPRVAAELHRCGVEARELPPRVRNAILLLDLDDVRLARSLLVKADPNSRSAFLEEIQNWHGTLAAWPAIVDAADDEDFRSALCAAVGRVDRTRLDQEVWQSLVAVLSRQYQQAPDPGTHAAAEWSLRQWGIPLPSLAGASGKGRWFVNNVSMTMMRVPAGVFPHAGESAETVLARGATGQIRRVGLAVTVLPSPYYVCDREVTLGLYKQFMADTAAERPQWEVPRGHATKPDHPVLVSQLEYVAPFCNWLSVRERRRRCYSRDAKSPALWSCDYTADGYRLPTDAEWDHAQRAGAWTRYFFGDASRWLPMYAHVANEFTAPGGTKLPNRWGLFDVVGNVWEATGDGVAWDQGQRVLSTMAVRGGGVHCGPQECQALIRQAGQTYRAYDSGCRVVCGSAERTDELLPDPRDRGAALAYLDRNAGDDLDLILLRAEMHGCFSHWRAAAADYLLLVKRSSLQGDYDEWITAAALLAREGDAVAYQKMCVQTLDRFDRTSDPLAAERVAKACLLAPSGNIDRVDRLLDTASRKGTPEWVGPYVELTRALVEYRRGKHAAALDRLEKCRTGLSDECQALRGFLLAMVSHRLGRSGDAGKAFEQARALRARLAESQAERGDAWKGVLHATIAEAEAKKLLERHK